MKSLLAVLMIGMMVFSVSFVFAEETELTPSQTRWFLMKKTVGFGTGFFAGFVGHELGHSVVAEIEDVDITWSGSDWRTHTEKKSEVRNISLGGFAEQILSSEIILGCDKIPKDNAFVLGYMAWNIINPIIYTLKNETRSGGHGDLKTIDKSGLNSEYVELVIVGHALLSAYRLYKKPEFPFFIKATHQELIIGLAWRW